MRKAVVVIALKFQGQGLALIQPFVRKRGFLSWIMRVASGYEPSSTCLLQTGKVDAFILLGSEDPIHATYGFHGVLDSLYG